MGAALLYAPMLSAQNAKKEPAMSEDMRQAIAFQHNKDLADARQTRLEAKHPSVTYDANRSADRSMEDSTEGNKVKDPGPATVRKDKQ
jgi:beta-galactosidase beta subunit